MRGTRGWILLLFCCCVASSSPAATPPFEFARDSFGFANMTVFEYKNGVARLRRGDDAKQKRYTRRCFVLSRSAMQFRKFARFEPHAPMLDDAQLAARIREVTRRAAWKPTLPENERVVFSGYAGVREMSQERGRVLQDNVGKGWPTYWRPGNWRMILEPFRGYQIETHQNLNATLARGDFFVAFLTTLPWHIDINHAVLVYQRMPGSHPGEDHYLAYDSNRPEGPRELVWSESARSFSYEKDWDFVGGNVRVYQVYGKLLQ